MSYHYGHDDLDAIKYHIIHHDPSLHYFQKKTFPMTDNGHYTVSDSLLTGRGYTPDYGINQSISPNNSWEESEKVPRPSAINTAIKFAGSERVWVVAMCSLIACLASLVNGMMLGFSSPALTQLQFNVSEVDRIKDTDIRYSLFGVCVMLSTLQTHTVICYTGLSA